ncbi:enhanced intracellular survival protein Eis [Mycobacterium kyorinense]|nr:enhanced intracellular survival protein Eis [Mycobacterium kyorinense]
MSDAVAPGLTLRSATEDDWPAMALLAATGFGEFGDPGSLTLWRSLLARDGIVLICDEALEQAVVGMSLYLDLRLTVPGGAMLPTAGVSLVVVAPTHRRRGLLRAMYTELHQRIADSAYPIAALTASEGSIYGRFGYGPATIKHELSVDRTLVGFHADAPDPSGVRLVRPAEHREELAAVYERWRLQTPGGLARPQPLWDELLADREAARRGGTPWFGLLHPDGYALYRVHDHDQRVARVAELRAVTNDAHAALWRALLGLDLMKSVATATHPDDPLPYLLTDTRLARTTGRQDDLWLRIMDIPTALEARSYQSELAAVVEVFDGFRCDGGRFALDIRDGRARCRASDAPADIEMDLDVLGGLYLGVHRAPAFAAANRLRGNDPELIRRLDAAFVSDVPAQLGFSF